MIKHAAKNMNNFKHEVVQLHRKLYTIIHLVKNTIMHLYDDANKQMYDCVDCFSDKFEQRPTCMKVFRFLAACFIFPTSVQTFV